MFLGLQPCSTQLHFRRFFRILFTHLDLDLGAKYDYNRKLSHKSQISVILWFSLKWEPTGFNGKHMWGVITMKLWGARLCSLPWVINRHRYLYIHVHTLTSSQKGFSHFFICLMKLKKVIIKGRNGPNTRIEVMRFRAILRWNVWLFCRSL